MDYKERLDEIKKRTSKASSSPWLGIFTSLAAGVAPKPPDVDFLSNAYDDIDSLLTIVLYLERSAKQVPDLTKEEE